MSDPDVRLVAATTHGRVLVRQALATAPQGVLVGFHGYMTTKIVYAGFSQGVAMAFRAALRGRHGAAGVIAVGGDVPPELLEDQRGFPFVLLVRGRRDDWFTAGKFRADLNALAARGRVRALEHEGGHEWNQPVADAAADFLASL